MLWIGLARIGVAHLERHLVAVHPGGQVGWAIAAQVLQDQYGLHRAGRRKAAAAAATRSL